MGEYPYDSYETGWEESESYEPPPEPVYEEPVAEEPPPEPVYEEPVGEEPPPEPVYEAPVVEAPPPEPAVEEAPPEPVVEEPVLEEPVVEEPVVEEPPPEPVVEEAPPEPVYKEPIVEEVSAEAVYEEPIVEEVSAEAVYNEPVVEEASGEPVYEEPVPEEAMQQPGVEEPLAEDTAVEVPPEPTYDAPTGEEPVGESVYEESGEATPETSAIEDAPVEDRPEAAEAEPTDFATVDETGFVFTGDMSSWSAPGPPEQWETWTPPAPPTAASWTDEGYSTDWGLVEAECLCNGEEPFVVTEPTVSSLVGPGHGADVHWAYQGNTNYCGLYSVNSIISEMYGQRVDTNEMVSRAAANGWLVYDENGQVKGIQPRDIDDILASYGVGSRNIGGPDSAPVADADAWQTLNDALTNGRRVVLGVDGREFDRGGDVGVAGAIDMDHFVAVTGVDYARGVVIVNDSARAAGLEVPIDLFFESWRDSNFSMTLTDTSVTGDGTAEPPTGASAPPPDAPEFGALGMTLQPSGGVAEAASTDLGDVCCQDLAAPVDAGADLLVTPVEAAPVAEQSIAATARADVPQTSIPAASPTGPTVYFTPDNRLVVVPAAPPAGYAIAAPLSNVGPGPANWSYPGAGIDSGVSTLWNIFDRQRAIGLNAVTGIPGDVGAYTAMSSGGIDFVRSGEATPSLLPRRS